MGQRVELALPCVPAHHDLQHLMQPAQGDRLLHPEAPPDRRFDVVEAHVQLQSRNLRWRLPGGGWHGCWSIRYQIRSSDPKPLIELEVAAVLGADRHGRTDERLGYRNGSRPRLLTTQVGDLPLSSRNAALAASSRRASNPADLAAAQRAGGGNLGS